MNVNYTERTGRLKALMTHLDSSFKLFCRVGTLQATSSNVTIGAQPLSTPKNCWRRTHARESEEGAARKVKMGRGSLPAVYCSPAHIIGSW